MHHYSWNEKVTFRRFVEVCQRRIQEALLRYRWQEAAELLRNYFQSLEDKTTFQRRWAPEVIWRMGTEILLHHPETRDDDINSFHGQMKNIGLKIYLKVCLEHAFHMLCGGNLDEAHRGLTVAESWRYGGTYSQQELLKFIQAYRALLDYCTWCKKRSMMSKEDLEDHTETTVSQDLHNYFRQAFVTMQEIFKNPGVWDPFVISCVDMLEFYEDHEEALKLLEFYAYDKLFVPNPNAFVYLYTFLKKHQAKEKAIMKVLKSLHQHVPSHQLMLEFLELLEKSKKQKHCKLGLTVSFTLLDYPDWKNNLDVWKLLVKQMSKAANLKHTEWIQKQWELRINWWPDFHFSASQAKKNFIEQRSLAYRKALVAGVLQGKGSIYFKCICRRWKSAKKSKLKRMKKFVVKHSLVQCE
ncbi:TATA box-binding protein-associated factor RNA polymerase I subunit A [Protopterus annectens]|uniref:TATA box-binding protein-associated factor RNA polymerase I subunit A n=1 Tax=Protopterus annectens TaxID=7888 RepID=UPI001CF9736F|nr:TATA box-binding protein-associated factor RNA polymerase I subunit A [Protopterus annectens]